MERELYKIYMEQLIAKPTGKRNTLRVDSIFKHENLQNIKIIECPQLQTDQGKRYIIIETTTNLIIDTADGWGYKSEQTALNGYKCKLKYSKAK